MPPDDVACPYCGAAARAAPPPPPAAATSDRETLPAELPPPHEARRIQGIAVPLVAALVVLGIGFPLTALAVSQVGRLPSTTQLLPPTDEPGAGPGVPGAAVRSGSGRARLTGAVTYEGPVTPIGCTTSTPRVATIDAGPNRFTVLTNAPGVAPGTYPLATATGTFVAVSRATGGSQMWTSLGRAAATGEITIGADRSVSARFSGLEANGGGAEGTVDGTIEMRCA